MFLNRVLIVEDEAMISMMIEDCLDHLGYDVVAVASHLDDGLEKARTLDIDVAVLDVNLHGKLSYPIAEMLVDRHIPFIFATGYGRAGLPENLRNVLVVTKPFREQQLADALRAATAGASTSGMDPLAR
ncbi:response regulator [Lichenicola cladoniae]|nr:response regulator [Lichenicola cladoniae]